MDDTAVKLLPEGFSLIEDLESLKEANIIKKQDVYVYDPNKEVFHKKYAWSAVEERINDLIEKGLLYGRKDS